MFHFGEKTAREKIISNCGLIMLCLTAASSKVGGCSVVHGRSNSAFTMMGNFSLLGSCWPYHKKLGGINNGDIISWRNSKCSVRLTWDFCPPLGSAVVSLHWLCHLKTPHSWEQPASLPMLSSLAHFRKTQQFSLDKLQRICVPIRKLNF